MNKSKAQTPTSINDTVTIPEAAKILGVHTNTVRRYINEGKMTVVKRFGSRAFFIPRAEVEALKEPQVLVRTFTHSPAAQAA